MKNEGEAWIKKKTGLAAVDLGSVEGVKKLIKDLADSYVKKVTDGKLTHMPTSIEEAGSMAKELIKSEGEAYQTRILKKKRLFFKLHRETHSCSVVSSEIDSKDEAGRLVIARGRGCPAIPLPLPPLPPPPGSHGCSSLRLNQWCLSLRPI